MFTPIDIQNHSLKTAVRGYSKKETDDFLDEILKSYEELYKENRDLKDKINSLNEGMQHYKEMEATLQKALVLAEKTSAETQAAAQSKANAILGDAEREAAAVRQEIENLLQEANNQVAMMKNEAVSEADALKKEAKSYLVKEKARMDQELVETKGQVRRLAQTYEQYRVQLKQLAENQIAMLQDEKYQMDEDERDFLEPVGQQTQTVYPNAQNPSSDGTAAETVERKEIEDAVEEPEAAGEVEQAIEEVEEDEEETDEIEVTGEDAEREARTEAAAKELLARIRESIEAEKVEIEKTQPIDTEEVRRAEQSMIASASDSNGFVSQPSSHRSKLPSPALSKQQEESVHLETSAPDTSESPKVQTQKSPRVLTADDMPPVFKTTEPKGDSPFTFIDL